MPNPPDDSRLELLQGTIDMLILRTLQWGSRHGHGIGQMIRTQSDELLKVETGSLYPALHRLEKRGWLSSSWGVSEANQLGHISGLVGTGFVVRSDGWVVTNLHVIAGADDMMRCRRLGPEPSHRRAGVESPRGAVHHDAAQGRRHRLLHVQQL